ncbi:MAG: hypothetical protein ACK5WB_01400 [Phycisphaerales bacterium]|nr:hypothetical protein [Phycisphaeraceae bacterium]
MRMDRTMGVAAGGVDHSAAAARARGRIIAERGRIIAALAAIAAMLGFCAPMLMAQTLRVQGQPWTLEVPAGWRVATDAQLAGFNNTTYTASGGRTKPAQVMLVRADDPGVFVTIMGDRSAEAVPSLDELARQFAEQGQKVAPGLGLMEVSFDRAAAMGVVIVRMDAAATGAAALGGGGAGVAGGARISATMLRFGRETLVSVAGVSPAGVFASARPRFAEVARAVRFDAGTEHPEMSAQASSVPGTATSVPGTASGGASAASAATGAAAGGDASRSMLAVGVGLGIGVAMLGVAVVLALRLSRPAAGAPAPAAGAAAPAASAPAPAANTVAPAGGGSPPPAGPVDGGRAT